MNVVDKTRGASLRRYLRNQNTNHSILLGISMEMALMRVNNNENVPIMSIEARIDEVRKHLLPKIKTEADHKVGLSMTSLNPEKSSKSPLFFMS